MMLFPPKLFSRSFIYGPNEEQALSWGKRNGWNVLVDLSLKNYCTTTRQLFQFAFADFQMGVSAQQSAESSGKGGSGNRNLVTYPELRRRKVTECTTFPLPFQMTCNLKESNDTHPQILGVNGPDCRVWTFNICADWKVLWLPQTFGTMGKQNENFHTFHRAMEGKERVKRER